VRQRGAHQRPSVIRGAKPGVEVGNRNTYELTNLRLTVNNYSLGGNYSKVL
jgi:hypothetical protein